MVQKLKRTNKKRLASLTALGAGVLGVAACPANANDIVFSGVINAHFPYTIPGPGGAGGVLKYNPGCQITCFSFGHAIYIVSKLGTHGTQFRLLATGSRNSWVKGEPGGAIWATAAKASTKSASIVYTFDGGTPQTTFTSTDRYMLFRFRGGALAHDMYGWARIKITTGGVVGGHSIPNGGVDIIDWAYDTSGFQLPAGYHGDGQYEPEDMGALQPRNLDATGLPALALGAVGVRNWRAARITAASNAAAASPAP